MSIEPPAQLALRAEISELERLHRWIAALCELHQLPARLSFQLDFCLAELVTNVISYGYPGAQAAEQAVAVQFAGNATGIVLEIVDQGVEFDPLAYVPPPRPRTLEDAPIGGRGLLLVRQFVGQLHYRREQGRNR